MEKARKKLSRKKCNIEQIIERRFAGPTTREREGERVKKKEHKVESSPQIHVTLEKKRGNLFTKHKTVS